MNPILFVPLAILLLMVLYLYLMHRTIGVRKPKLPVSAHFQRSPGQSLYAKMKRIHRRIAVTCGLLLLIPLAFGSGYAAIWFYFPKPVPFWELSVSSLLVVLLWSYTLVRLTGLMIRYRCVKRGYENEVEVGAQLHRLVDLGCHVLHDVPAGQFNISHVVVGQKGVFAVNTPARSKPSSHRRKARSIVEYNGKVLYFPDEKDLQTVELAEHRANWLSDWIGRTAGEQIAVRAMVAVPGWTVKRTSAEGIPVVNPQQIPSLFEHINPRPLSEASIASIVAHLESRCRSTDPVPSA